MSLCTKLLIGSISVEAKQSNDRSRELILCHKIPVGINDCRLFYPEESKMVHMQRLLEQVHKFPPNEFLG